MATVYLNAATGNDSNTYAQAQNPATPWLTPGKVNTSATTGDSVVMAAGTYTFASVTFSTKSFTWTGSTIFTNNLPTTILDGGGAAATWTGQPQTINNILFQNTVPAGGGNGLFNSILPTFSNCVFRTITFGGSNCQLIRSYPVGGCTMNNCLIMNTPLSTVNDQYIFGTNGAINLTNCIISITGSYTGIIIKAYSAMTATIKNTIISNSGGGTITYSNGSVTNAVTYSDLYNITSGPTDTGVITTAPLFVDEANGNFNLRPASPAIDTGSL